MNTISTQKQNSKKKIETQSAYSNNADCQHLMLTPSQKVGLLDSITISTEEFSIDLEINQCSENPLLKYNYPVPALSKWVDSRDIEGLPLFRQKEIALLVDNNGIPIICDSLRASKPIRETGILNISRINNKVYLSVQCSVPKFIGKQNIYLADDNDFSCFISELEKELSESGIYINPRKCNVNRLDITKNVETKYAFPQYIPLLRKLQFSRDKLSREYNNQTYLVGNGSKVLCCYNKIAEMKSQNLPIDNLPSDIFRAEYRALKKDSVKSIYGFKTVSDVESSFADIECIYKETLKKDFFRNDVLEDDDSEVSEMEIMRKAIQESGKGKKNFYEAAIIKILVQDSRKVLNDLCGKTENILDMYREHLEENGASPAVIRQSISRQRMKIRDVNAMMLQYMDSDIENVTLQELYNELYEKLIG